MAEDFSAAGRAGVLRRREGRPLRHRRGRANPRPGSRRAPRRSASRPTFQRLSRRSSGTSSASRATRSAPPISEMGPLLLVAADGSQRHAGRRAQHRLPIADDEGLLLLDLKDLQALLEHLAEHAGELTTKYGNVTKATVGTIQRQLLALEQQGGGAFLRRAGARDRRPHARRRATGAASSTCSPPTS